MSLSEDLNSDGTYEPTEHSLIEKKSRLIAAVVQNDVHNLSQLLDSPKWYYITDDQGDGLLHIAVLHHRKDVFDYMLSIPDFPLNLSNFVEKTALQLAFTRHFAVTSSSDQYYACELIKKGACVDFVCYNGNTPLLCALEKSYDEVALLLIKMGVDLNVCNDDGETPIYKAISISNNEVLAALLVEGAIPSVDDFNRSVLCNCSVLIQNLLFLHSVDQYSVIDFEVLLQLAEDKSPLFHEIVRYLCEIIISSGISSIENLDMFIERGFKFDVGKVNGTKLLQDLLILGYDESHISKVYLYLLSYGLVLHERDLQLVYRNFGCCQLFKLFLHMDIKYSAKETHKRDIVAVFIYDITMNVEKFLENASKFSLKSINRLFDYFVHPGLTELYYVIKKHDRIIQIPRLLELARNSFRNYFIETFKIETTRKFYTLLKRLPISIIHERIISYETKLY